MILGLTYGFLPFMILPLYASIERMDQSLVEASYDLGHGKVSTFFRVILPTVSPGLVAGVLLVFIPAVGDFVTPELLGGVKTQMFGNTIDDQFASGNNWPLGSAMSVLLMALHPDRRVRLPRAASARTRCETREEPAAAALPQGARVRRVRVLVRADRRARGVQLQPGAQRHQLDRLLDAVVPRPHPQRPRRSQAFRNTLKVAITATIVATIIGTLAAFALTRFQFRGRSGYSTLVFVSLVMPEVVMGISMPAFFKQLRALASSSI